MKKEFIFFLIYSSFTLGMVPIKTLEGETIPISIIESQRLLEVLQKNAHILNGQFSQNLWNVLLDLWVSHELVEHSAQKELLSFPNIFDEHRCTAHEVDKLWEVILILEPHPFVINALVEAYLVFIAKRLKRPNTVPSLFRKYYYLCHRKQYENSDNHAAYVSLKQLIDFENIVIDKQNNSLNLNDLYLQSIEGWRDLEGRCALRPELITTINLTNNKLKNINSLSLGAFTNLKAFIAENNQIEDLPNDIFYGCVCLTFITFANNRLNTLPPELLRDCSELIYLNLTNNQLESLPENFFNNCPTIKFIYIKGNRISNLSNIVTTIQYLPSISRFEHDLENKIQHNTKSRSSLKYFILTLRILSFPMYAISFYFFPNERTLSLIYEFNSAINSRILSEIR